MLVDLGTSISFFFLNVKTKDIRGFGHDGFTQIRPFSERIVFLLWSLFSLFFPVILLNHRFNDNFFSFTTTTAARLTTTPAPLPPLFYF